MSGKSKIKRDEIKTKVEKIMLVDKITIPAQVKRELEKEGHKISNRRLYRLCSEIEKNDAMPETAQPNETTGDSTSDEIDNLTSLIAKLNKEFDKTDSNSERCRITDAIVSASKGRADLLLKKDERERLRQTKDNQTIIIKFGEPTVIDDERRRKTFGLNRNEQKQIDEQKKPDEQKPVESKPQIAPIEKQSKCECCGNLAHCRRSLSNNMVCDECIDELNERYRDDHAEV